MTADPDVLAERIAALERSMAEGFAAVQGKIDSSLRHRDRNAETTVNMLTATISRLEENQRDLGRRQAEHERWTRAQFDEHNGWAGEQLDKIEHRFRALEDQQLTWRSNRRLLGALFAGGLALGSFIGTYLSAVVV